MQRRKFVAGIGSLAAAGAAGIGTGAFTSVEADRDFTVDVADDANAFLRMVAVPGSGNSDYVKVRDGQLSGDLSGGNDSLLGDGVNSGAVTTVDDLFRIENHGTQPVYVWILEDGGRNGSKNHAFYVGSWSDDATAISLADFNGDLDALKGDGRQRQPQYDAGVDTAAVKLGVGDYVDVGLVVDTPQGSSGSRVLKDGQGPVIHATAEHSSLADVLTPVHTPNGPPP
ncbi:DUF1102 domain-containing protein [Halobacterium sp. R2-5]|uniref:DUF1102 domain-containing protein n=1 Tax=Halobacterium sp. R2-5 TaxID=2715751 RepID=UPI0014249363|nr:DUF1102 domain-containing protein [Halobacterium sp. R2-5]NIB98093.1 DUF1102 domain-containing protein [Halobacterium sp. R2-5]